MPEILFLLGNVADAHNDNHERLPRGFRAAGWRATTLPHDAVRLNRNSVLLDDCEPGRFQLIWLVGFGRSETFLDRMQLLRMLDQNRFVTAVDALIHLHAKTPWAAHLPETYAASDLGFLQSVLDSGGEWVAKPTAASFGRDVVRIRSDADGRARLARLVGPIPGRYCLLQRYVPAAEQGEKRTLVAGGRIIGSYLRRPGEDFRANIAEGATAEPTSLTADETLLVAGIAKDLTRYGVGFAAVDTVYPYLMEVNVANPGGLSTMESLYGRDLTRKVVDAVAAAKGFPAIE